MTNGASSHSAARPCFDLLLNLWSGQHVSPSRAEGFDPRFEFVLSVGSQPRLVFERFEISWYVRFEGTRRRDEPLALQHRALVRLPILHLSQRGACRKGRVALLSAALPVANSDPDAEPARFQFVDARCDSPNNLLRHRAPTPSRGSCARMDAWTGDDGRCCRTTTASLPRRDDSNADACR